MTKQYLNTETREAIRKGMTIESDIELVDKAINAAYARGMHRGKGQAKKEKEIRIKIPRNAMEIISAGNEVHFMCEGRLIMLCPPHVQMNAADIADELKAMGLEKLARQVDGLGFGDV